MARHSHTAVQYMGNMVVFGGELANGSLASDVWMYRPVQDDWQQLGFSHSRGAPKLANHAAAVVDTYLYIFGGEGDIPVSHWCVWVLKLRLYFEKYILPLPMYQVALRRTCFPQLCIASVCTVLDDGKRFSPPVENPLPLLATLWCSTAHPGLCWSTEATGLLLQGTHSL